MNADMESAQNRLIAEQLGHTLDLVKAELEAIKAEHAHGVQMSQLRLNTLEAQSADYEKRLRELTESATQFKLLVSLAAGGGLLSLIELVRYLFHP